MTVAEDRETEAEDETSAVVTAHASSPEKTVFTERGNTDAWISTDTTVDLDR
jgi:hypothetical protein